VPPGNRPAVESVALNPATEPLVIACVVSGAGGELVAVETWLRALTMLALISVVSTLTAAAPCAASAPPAGLVSVVATEAVVG
jgi:hypothetical protein